MNGDISGKPYWLFLIYFMLFGSAIMIDSPITPERGFYLTSILLVSIIFVYSIIYMDGIYISKWFFVFISIYYIWMSLNAIIYHDSHTIPYLILTPIVFITIIILFPKLVNRKKMLLPYTLSVFGVVLVLIGILLLLLQEFVGLEYSSHTGRDILGISNIRITSIFYNGNTFAIFLCFSSLSSIYLFINQSKSLWWTIPINIVGLFLTNGQASYLAFVTATVLLLGKDHLRFLTTFFVSGLALGTGVILTGFIDSTPISGYLSGRNYLWQGTLRALIETPIFGVNPPIFAEAIGQYIPEGGERYRGDTTHNSYFMILVKYGVVGGLSYMSAVVYVLLQNGKIAEKPWDGYIVASLSAIVTIMIFEDMTLGGLSTDSIFLAVFLGLAHERIVSHSQNP